MPIREVVLVSDWASHVRAGWEMPWMSRVFRRLGSFRRLILFDKRGTGMSDPVAPSELGILEERIDDVRAVLDDAGSDRAALMAANESGPVAVMFAATYPTRTSC